MNSRSEVLCYNCWSYGHIRFSCPDPPRSLGQEEILRHRKGVTLPPNSPYLRMIQGNRCWNCWTTGHVRELCPMTALSTKERERLRIEKGVPMTADWSRQLKNGGLPLDSEGVDRGEVSVEAMQHVDEHQRTLVVSRNPPRSPRPDRVSQRDEVNAVPSSNTNELSTMKNGHTNSKHNRNNVLIELDDGQESNVKIPLNGAAASWERRVIGYPDLMDDVEQDATMALEMQSYTALEHKTLAGFGAGGDRHHSRTHLSERHSFLDKDSGRSIAHLENSVAPPRHPPRATKIAAHHHTEASTSPLRTKDIPPSPPDQPKANEQLPQNTLLEIIKIQHKMLKKQNELLEKHLEVIQSQSEMLHHQNHEITQHENKTMRLQSQTILYQTKLIGQLLERI